MTLFWFLTAVSRILLQRSLLTPLNIIRSAIRNFLLYALPVLSLSKDALCLLYNGLRTTDNYWSSYLNPDRLGLPRGFS